jgi:hypothetical protein
MRSRWAGRAAAGLALALALPVVAAIPGADRIAGAVAEANDHAGRAGPLLLRVSLRVVGSGSTAEGELATHPTGLARLELRSPAGFVERHLLLGDEYRASRDGELLDRPHPFLPPVFLLQATSGATLSAALSSLGVHSQEVVLGRLGDHDCYVFGGRLAPAPPDEEPLLPSLWVDIGSYDPVRVVRTDGTEYRLGPTEVYDGIRLPRWIDIQARRLRARLEILSAAKADAPAAAFQSEWLIAPVGGATPTAGGVSPP